MHPNRLHLSRAAVLGLTALLSGADLTGQERARTVAIVLYEGFELLDAMGPAEVFTHVGMMREIDDEPAVRVLLAASRAGPVRSQNGVRVLADVALADCPAVDLVLVPGGATIGLQGDAAAMADLRRLTGGSRIVMSVCNGAHVLAGMGLLDGRRATTHSSLLDGLERRFPKIEVVRGQRVVTDRRRGTDQANDPADLVTTAGVSAGIDGALAVIERWFDQDLARHVRGFIEWPAEEAAATPAHPHGPGHGVDDAALAPGERRLLAAIESAADEGGLDSAAGIERIFGWLRRALAEGYAEPGRLLVEPALQPLLADPDHRGRLSRLVRDHTREAQARIGAPSEPGRPLTVHVSLIGNDGEPAAGALVFVYQADHRGFYAPEAESAGEGNRNPRLFAWLKADAEGRIGLRTVLPGGYGGAPPHFHVGVSPDGTVEGARTGGSLYLEGDWPMDDEVYSDAKAGAAWVLPVVEREGRLEVRGTLQLR